jgi:hypothetical protein
MPPTIFVPLIAALWDTLGSARQRDLATFDSRLGRPALPSMSGPGER